MNVNSELENYNVYEDNIIVDDTTKEDNMEAERAHEVNSNSIDDYDYKIGEEESVVEERREENGVEEDGLHKDYKGRPVSW